MLSNPILSFKDKNFIGKFSKINKQELRSKLKSNQP